MVLTQTPFEPNIVMISTMLAATIHTHSQSIPAHARKDNPLSSVYASSPSCSWGSRTTPTRTPEDNGP
jgi:hypothetical protein